MKPKIVTRLANIAAKLAGSDKYDSTVKPVTPLEYYMNEIPVTPKPNDRDAGKNLVVGDNGAYELQTPTKPVEVPQPAVADAGKFLGVDGNGAYELQPIPTPVDVPEPTVADSGKFLGVDENGNYALAEAGGGANALKIIFTGTTSITCDTSYNDIAAAILAGTPIVAVKRNSVPSSAPVTYSTMHLSGYGIYNNAVNGSISFQRIEFGPIGPSSSAISRITYIISPTNSVTVDTANQTFSS